MSGGYVQGKMSGSQLHVASYTTDGAFQSLPSGTMDDVVSPSR